jgi:hypothetical protein
VLQRDVLISAVADDQLKEHGVIAVSFASPKETPVRAQDRKHTAVVASPPQQAAAQHDEQDGWQNQGFVLCSSEQVPGRSLISRL